MNKNIFEVGFKALVVAGLIAVIFMLKRDDESIVYVDAIKLMNGYKGMVTARKEYDAKTLVWKTNVDSLKTELQTEISNYEKREKTLSVAERELTERMLQAKEEQFLTYQKAIAEKVQQADQELTNKVVTRVNDYIKRYGEDKGYAIIMAATQYGNIVYARQGKDITEEVLQGLNKEYGE